jgi:hypothetical protein
MVLGTTIVYFATADYPKEMTTAWGRPSTLFAVRCLNPREGFRKEGMCDVNGKGGGGGRQFGSPLCGCATCRCVPRLLFGSNFPNASI